MTGLLVLGGTRHVGRAAVLTALERGWEVTVVNRGRGPEVPDGARALRADRTVDGELAAALDGEGPWDVVLDTWSASPDVVDASARLLAGRAAHYAYVSSVSVYQWPWPRGVDESAPVVDVPVVEPDYATDKRGAEVAVVAAFGADRCIIARAGLILGPYEMVGRLPWWLRRLAAGGRVLAPGPASRPLQFIDGRDLSAWLLSTAAARVPGIVNVVGPSGAMTMGELVQAGIEATGADVALDWVTPADVEIAGLAPWTQLPIWAPPDGELAAIHHIDGSRAVALGLVTRPPAHTVTDTWRWLCAEGYPPTVLEGRIGIDAATEQAARTALGRD